VAIPHGGVAGSGCQGTGPAQLERQRRHHRVRIEPELLAQQRLVQSRVLERAARSPACA
jgi:50S ribosomal subunit-associated GTPase HflX